MSGTRPGSGKPAALEPADHPAVESVGRPAAARAVVFAYHNVGVRCLEVLLAGGVEVALVVTHEDAAGENIWFGNVRRSALDYGLPVITPADANTPQVVQSIARLQPDFIFSFYYRQMLRPPLLAIAPRGALNMHGSLLPRFRGRAPVNWAVLHGATSTGASLHYMVEKPDAGDLVAQTEVPILPNDTAHEVFEKVTVAAELTLWRVLPQLLAGTAPRQPLDLTPGNYFGGRKPQDGQIDWRQGAWVIHNLVRAVAPPYPGAFTDLDGQRLQIMQTRLLGAAGAAAESHGSAAAAQIGIDGDKIVARCVDGRYLWLRDVRLDGEPLTAVQFATRFPVPATMAS